MANGAERRRVARLPVPSQFNSSGLENEAVRLVDLSPEGACLEHLRPLPDWDQCRVLLPPALGGVRLQGEVVWSRVGGRRQGTNGEGRVYYQSGLRFTYLTSEQRARLVTAVEILKAAREVQPPARIARAAPGAPSETATGRV